MDFGIYFVREWAKKKGFIFFFFLFGAQVSFSLRRSCAIWLYLNQIPFENASSVWDKINTRLNPKNAKQKKIFFSFHKFFRIRNQKKNAKRPIWSRRVRKTRRNKNKIQNEGARWDKELMYDMGCFCTYTHTFFSSLFFTKGEQWLVGDSFIEP